jgi:hypothetical protein
MRPAILFLCAACASAPATREPEACNQPAVRAEVEQIQIGWNRLDPGEQPPIVDVAHPSRDPRQAESLANELLVRCKKGEKMAPLQDKYSEVQPGTLMLGADSAMPFKAASLCLRPGECAMVRGKIAFHVVKRIR